LSKVQLEHGTQATPFEHRPYGVELELCQRYFLKIGDVTSNLYTGFSICSAYSTAYARAVIYFPTTMRDVPSVTKYGSFETLPGGVTVSTITLADSGGNPQCSLNVLSSTSSLSVGNAYQLRAENDVDANLQFEAEL
jgi:hypothetical protein